MKDNELLELLRGQHYQFGNEFSNQVASAILKINQPVIKHLHWFFTGVAATILICLTAVYLEHGQLSFDAFLGIDSLYNDTLSETSIFL